MKQIEEKKDYRRTALALLRNSEGKLLIALNPRLNSNDPKNVDKDTYKFPQGGIEIGEDPKEALEREMKEELGLDITGYDVEELGDYVSYWFRNTDKPDYEIRLHAFLIEVGDLDVAGLKVDPEEVAEVRWVLPEEVQELDLGIRHQAYLSIMRRFGLD